MENDLNIKRENNEEMPAVTPVNYSDESENYSLFVDDNECKRIIEAVLFSLGRSVSVAELARACGIEAAQARRIARELAAEYDSANGAVLIREMDGMFQMCTSPRYYDSLIKVVSMPRRQELSEVVLETLAIIACRNPATKQDIESIRGVKSDHAVNRLLDYGLIEETGRKDAPGRPALFSPTQEFYRRFGLMDTAHMPSVGEGMEERIRDEVQQELRTMLGDDDIGIAELGSGD